MDYRRCKPACSYFIMSNDPHSVLSVCVFPHACKAVYRVSKCKFCENLCFKTLNTQLAGFDKESSVFPRRTPEATDAFRESATWGSDVELEAKESEQMGLTLSLPLSTHAYFGAASADTLLPNGQEELVDVLACTTEKLSIDWPEEPRKSQSSNLDKRFQIQGPRRGSCHFSAICIMRSPDPGRSLSLQALLTRQLLTSPTSWGSVEQDYTAITASEDTLATHLSPWATLVRGKVVSHPRCQPHCNWSG